MINKLSEYGKEVAIRITIVVLVLIATALQLTAQSPDAQRKEINPQSIGHAEGAGSIVAPPDAQRKEAPNIRPITVVTNWLTRIGILPSAQRKE